MVAARSRDSNTARSFGFSRTSIASGIIALLKHDTERDDSANVTQSLQIPGTRCAERTATRYPEFLSGRHEGSRGSIFEHCRYAGLGGRILAVIAMQFELSDKMAIHFSPIFYNELLIKKRSLQNAMTRTRLELRRRGFAEWITPVLYMRGRDASILRPDAPAAGIGG